MDAAEPPRIVFESRSECANGPRAEELFRQLAAPTLAPGRAWVVALRIDTAGHGSLRGAGEITDGQGAPVGHRVLFGPPGDCEGVARAIGVWASLVLDSELKRAHSAAAMPREGDVPSGAAAALSPAAAERIPQWPPSLPPEDPQDPPPEGEHEARHDERRTLELGMDAFLMTGTGGGAVIGATPFVVVELEPGFFLRPAVAFGQSVATLSASDATWLAARLDACMRLPGQYTSRHGLALDLCGGTDVGVTDGILPYIDVGPSLDLRGELGGDLSVILRGIFGVNLVRKDLIDWTGKRDPPPWSGRLELGLSWRLK